jgi:hypothetical protein
MEGKVRLGTQVEDIAFKYPEAVGFLTRRGVRCIRCGEPVWGPLSELLEEAGIEDPQSLIDELNAYIQEQRKNT